MQEEPEPRAAPRGLLVALVQLLAASLVISLLVRAIVDGWEVTDIAARVGVPIAVGVGAVLYQARQRGSEARGESALARRIIAAFVIGPAVVTLGVALGFVLDMTSIWVLLVGALAGLIIETAARGMRRRQKQRQGGPA